MNVTKPLNVLLLLAFLTMTGCSLPGADLTSSPDETERELKNAKYLKSIYDPIRGDYSLLLTDPKNRHKQRCVIMEVGYDEVANGKTSWGEPILIPNLFIKFTDLDGLIVEEKITTGRYYQDQLNNFSFTKTNAPKDSNGNVTVPAQFFQITGSLVKRHFEGKISLDGYTSGRLKDAELKTDPACPDKLSYRREYVSQIEKLFQGKWEGIAETTPSSASFAVELRVSFKRMNFDTEFFTFLSYAYYRRSPFGGVEPIGSTFQVGFNQNPITVSFKTEAGSFYGELIDNETIRGFISEKYGPRNLELKRITQQ